MSSIYDQHLGRTAANFAALSPVSFIERSAEVFGDLLAVIHGARRYTWRETRERSARLAAALRAMGGGRATKDLKNSTPGGAQGGPWRGAGRPGAGTVGPP